MAEVKVSPLLTKKTKRAITEAGMGVRVSIKNKTNQEVGLLRSLK